MAKNDIAIQMKTELYQLYSLLKSYIGEDNRNNIIDFSGIKASAEKLTIGKDGYWILEETVIVFRDLDLGKNICPNGYEIFEKSASLKIISHMSGIRHVLDDGSQDPIRPVSRGNIHVPGFSLQLVITIGDSDGHIAKASWHFDRHPDKKSDGKPDKNPDFNHPLYHLHFGGKEINQGQIEYGEVLLLESPRILHPPMDIVLAVDFVLGNFYSRSSGKVNELRDNPLYQKLVKNAQNRFWKPYFLGLAANFIGTNQYCFQGVSNLCVDKTFAKNLLAYRQEH
jgi:hypothetical protein